MRKIIFSRKGFDSGEKTGNGASPFLRDGEMMSFPIPAERGSAFADLIPYDGIRFADGATMKNRMEELRRGKPKWGPPLSAGNCHHDPDLVRDARRRPSKDGWRGIFGQSGPQQTQLENGKVGEGDLFLFFGWFNEAKKLPDGSLSFLPSPLGGVHALFGHLQVGKTLRVKEGMEIPECFSDHPHLTRERLELRRERKVSENDMVYIARERLSIPGGNDDLPGYGVFRHSPELVLTAEGRRRSFWELPKFFDGGHYPNNIRRATDGSSPDNWVYTTRGQWQECVVNATPEIREWALERIRIGMRAG